VHLAHREFALGQYFQHCLANRSGRADHGNIVSLSHQGLSVLVRSREKQE
jgi:hypothetical protein